MCLFLFASVIPTSFLALAGTSRLLELRRITKSEEFRGPTSGWKFRAACCGVMAFLCFVGMIMSSAVAPLSFSATPMPAARWFFGLSTISWVYALFLHWFALGRDPYPVSRDLRAFWFLTFLFTLKLIQFSNPRSHT
eukprot:GABV01009500.1.p1 GENE.GABV01009500.1~~GABV01009500.1.p1  ORF type:complete len:137 (+),score=13.39 GABV01009500.1:183-593(+)